MSFFKLAARGAFLSYVVKHKVPPVAAARMAAHTFENCLTAEQIGALKDYLIDMYQKKEGS